MQMHGIMDGQQQHTCEWPERRRVAAATARFEDCIAPHAIRWLCCRPDNAAFHFEPTHILSAVSTALCA